MLNNMIHSIQNAVSKLLPGLHHLTSLDKVELDKALTRSFDEAKKISDFIGMITRLAFVFIWVIYYYNKIGKYDVIFDSYRIGLSLFIGCGIALIFFERIMWVIYMFFAQDFGRQTRSQISNYLIAVLAFFITLLIGMSVWEISLGLAKVAKLA